VLNLAKLTEELMAADEGLLSSVGGGGLLPDTHKWQHVISVQEESV
jgi:hypothetical protein